MKFSKYISFQKFFFFLKIYFERKFSPDFGKPQKFHDLVFCFLLGLGRNLFLLKKISTRFGLQFGISSFPCFKNTFFLQIIFINSLEISTITIGSKVCNLLLRAVSSPVVKPSIFLPFNSMYSLKRFIFSS